MSEYINREELHCSNCCICSFKEELCDCNSEFCERYKGIGGAEDFIKAVLKTSIVHCKECSHQGTIDCPMDEQYADDYCSYGEKKDETD